MLSIEKQSFIKESERKRKLIKNEGAQGQRERERERERESKRARERGREKTESRGKGERENREQGKREREKTESKGKGEREKRESRGKGERKDRADLPRQISDGSNRTFPLECFKRLYNCSNFSKSAHHRHVRTPTVPLLRCCCSTI